MPSIPLQFIPPDVEDLVALNIYESANALGPFIKIETVNDIGVYPTYIDNYTTDLATSEDDWFAVDWTDAKGAVTPKSAPIKGGTTTLVDQIVSRVRQRDSSVSVQVVAQEAEGAIEKYLGVDPYTVYDPTVFSYSQLNGITYLVLARTFLVQSAQSSDVSSATLSLVSFRTESGTKKSVDVQALIDLAADELGISSSRVLQMCIEEVDYWVNVLEP